ncbi:hypothetical protein PSR62_09550 [Rhodopirellula sp. P2]|nr:hypothetical protein [Rhodopirellula sp. P2]WDQ18771.1 hypothetical protein PSR62_09550 [Rhodopirellula sp. P2]
MLSTFPLPASIRMLDRQFAWVGVMSMMGLLSLNAGCVRAVSNTPFPAPPVVLNASPDIHQLAAAVNRTDAIQQLSTNSAKVDVLSMPAVPKLNATVNVQREKRFRLKASVPIIMGAGIDLGSNENEFWFEVPDNMTQTLYYANHEQYARQLNRAILPVDPTWLIEAIGLARLDPATVLSGPVIRSDGLIEVRTSMQTPSGMYQRVVFIEPSAGYITNLFLYSPDGRQVAKSVASDHRFNATANVVLPHRVKIELFPAAGPPLAMQLEVASYTVNQLLSGDPELFTMPTTTTTKVDLVQMAGMGSPGGFGSHAAGAMGYSSATTGPIVPAAEAPWTRPPGLPGTAAAYSANAPTGPPLRGIRYE